MKIIHKVKLTIADGPIVVQIPKGAEILSIQMQKGVPCIWYICNIEEHEIERRTFLCIGTGESFYHSKMKYINTVQDGPYVWHFFERTQ